MSSLCNQLELLSQEIFDWIAAQPAVKEESLTNWLLYELSKRCKNIAYKEFTRHEEAKDTGADWDWLFVFSDGVAYFRVQAKKLSAINDNYSGLARTNRYGQQITKLIESAKMVSAFPIYAFYSASSSSNACKGRVFTKQGGSYLCGAEVVDSRFVRTRKHVSESDVVLAAYPLPCISCCSYGTEKSAKSLLEQVHHYFHVDGLTNSDKTFLGYSNRIPSWAESILENNMKFSADWEKEYSNFFTDTKALMIVDSRNLA